MLAQGEAPERARPRRRRWLLRGGAAASLTSVAAMDAPPAAAHPVQRRAAAEVAQVARRGKAAAPPPPALPPPPPPPPPPPGLSLGHLLASCAAGALAGVAVETLLFPIDTIKTRLQAARGGGPILWKGLYAGLAGNIAGVIPASALFMGVYEPTKRLGAAQGWSPLAQQLSAATLAGAAASLVRVPTEVVKTRMQTGQIGSGLQAVTTILRTEGLRKGLYAGYGSFLLRDLPFDAIEFVAYEQMKTALRAVRGGSAELGSADVAAVGCAAGVLTAALTTPLDVVKTRLMSQGAARTYAGIGDCLRQTVAQEGVGALFKGVQPRVLWIGLGGAIFFPVLEAAKAALLPLADKC